jgi:acyl carrier protein
MAEGVGEERWRSLGLRRLTPEEGLGVLDEVLSGGWTQVGVLSGVVGDAASVASKAAEETESEPALVRRLRESEEGRRRGLLLEYLRDEVKKLLGLKRTEGLPEDRGLVDLGLDSLMVVDLRNRLYESLGQMLPTTVAFDYPTLSALTDHILHDVLALEARAPAAAEEPTSSEELALLLDGLERLSDDEALALLAEKARGARQ